MISDNWSLVPTPSVSSELLALVDGCELLATVLAQRGYGAPADAQPFLNADMYRPSPPSALFGIDTAAALLVRTIQQEESILVWGDFDVDGQTSTALLVEAFHKTIGRDKVRYHIPNRFSEGHGIDLDVLKEILSRPDFSPSLLLTCDTGIAEGPAIGYAKDQQLTVIITDHHDLTPELQSVQPKSESVCGLSPFVVGHDSVRRADAIVNPKLQPPGDALGALPGVGVAYKLVQEVFSRIGHSGAEHEYLDLVALGIVADVAEQVHDTRYLLQRGIEQLRVTQRAGLLALMNIARIVASSVDTQAIGYQLSPRLNALGRLDDATVAVELLITEDPTRADQLAAKMERINQQRRLLTSQITGAAMEMLDRRPQLLDFGVLVLSHPAWHAGIVGIVAARLAEEFQRPAVLLLTPPGELARGSARSVPGIDIGASIAACGHLLVGHGGHPGAAGLRLLPENIDRLRRESDRQVQLHRTPDLVPGLSVDAVLPFDALDISLAEWMQRLAPFGNGNPTPHFMSERLDVIQDRRIGREGAHRRLAVASANSPSIPVIWFNGGDLELPRAPIDLVYELSTHEYRGKLELQLLYVDSRSSRPEFADAAARCATKAAQGATKFEQRYQVHDLRAKVIVLQELPSSEQAVWYAEGANLESAEENISYAPRQDIRSGVQAAQLVIWSIPPSPRLLHWLIDAVEPRTVYLCGRHTADDSPSTVLRQVAGMGKFALSRGLPLILSHMAARLGTTEAVIRSSLFLLESRGTFEIGSWIDGDRVEIYAGLVAQRAAKTATDGLQANTHLAALTEHLAEVRAYRRFFARSSADELGLGA